MSAWIVSHETMHHCVRVMSPNSYTKDQKTELGRLLFALNRRAVLSRYGALDQGEETEGDDYIFSFRDVGGMQLFKSLQCFWYQCSEGEVVNDPLFLAVDRRVGTLRDSIAKALHIRPDKLTDHPAYEAAKWGAV